MHDESEGTACPWMLACLGQAGPQDGCVLALEVSREEPREGQGLSLDP